MVRPVFKEDIQSNKIEFNLKNGTNGSKIKWSQSSKCLFAGVGCFHRTKAISLSFFIYRVIINGLVLIHPCTYKLVLMVISSTKDYYLYNLNFPFNFIISVGF